MMLGLLVVYVAVGSYMEHKQFKFGHETGAIILIATIVAIIIWKVASYWGNKYSTGDITVPEWLEPEHNAHIEGDAGRLAYEITE